MELLEKRFVLSTFAAIAGLAFRCGSDRRELGDVSDGQNVVT